MAQNKAQRNFLFTESEMTTSLQYMENLPDLKGFNSMQASLIPNRVK